MSSILAVAGLERTSREFRRALVDVANELDVEVDDLAAVISFESAATFAPDVRNPITGAVGLIQFLAVAAKLVGSTQDELSRMTATAQLRGPVVRYFKRTREAFGEGSGSLSDVYMTVLSPKAIGRGAGFVLLTKEKNPNQYEANRGLDVNSDGAITVGEATRRIRDVQAAAGGRRISVATSPIVVAAVGALAGLAAAWLVLRS